MISSLADSDDGKADEEKQGIDDSDSFEVIDVIFETEAIELSEISDAPHSTESANREQNGLRTTRLFDTFMKLATGQQQEAVIPRLDGRRAPIEWRSCSFDTCTRRAVHRTKRGQSCKSCWMKSRPTQTRPTSKWIGRNQVDDLIK